MDQNIKRSGKQKRVYLEKGQSVEDAIIEHTKNTSVGVELEVMDPDSHEVFKRVIITQKMKIGVKRENKNKNPENPGMKNGKNEKPYSSLPDEKIIRMEEGQSLEEAIKEEAKGESVGKVFAMVDKTGRLIKKVTLTDKMIGDNSNNPGNPNGDEKKSEIVVIEVEEDTDIDQLAVIKAKNYEIGTVLVFKVKETKEELKRVNVDEALKMSTPIYGENNPAETLTPETRESAFKGGQVSEGIILPEELIPTVDISMATEEEKVEIINGFESSIRIGFSPIDHHIYWYRQRDMLDMWKNEKEFSVSMMKKANDLYNKYNKVIIGVPKVIEPIFRENKITDPASIGLNVWNILGSSELRKDDYIRLVGALRLFSNQVIETIKGRTNSENVVCFITPREFSAYKHFHERHTSKIIEFRRLWDFMRRFGDNEVIIEPIPRLDIRFHKSWVPPTMRALFPLITGNLELWEVLRDFMLAYVRKHIAVPITVAEGVMSHLNKLLRVRTMQAALINDVPKILSRANARTFIENALTVWYMGRYVRLRYEVDFDSLDLSRVLDCIMIKLTTRMNFWTKMSIMNIDNYLARWFLPTLPSFNSSRYEWDTQEAEYGNVNYLTKNLQNGCIGPKILNAVSAFLLTTDAGAGWLGSGMDYTEALPRTAAGYINPERKWWWRSLSGQYMDSEESRVTQFSLFEAMMTAVQGVGKMHVFSFVGYGSEFGDAMFRVLIWTQKSRRRLQAMNYYIDRLSRKLGLSSVLAPDQGEKTIDENYVTLGYPKFSAFSAVHLTNWNELTQVAVATQLMKWGQYVHAWANELVSKHHYIYDRTPSPLWKREERLALLKTMVKRSPSVFSSKCFDILSSYPLIYHYHIPSLDYVDGEYIEDMEFLEKWIKEDPDLFGYAKSFVFCPKPIKMKTSLIDDYWESRKETEVDRILDLSWKDLILSIQERDLQRVMQEARTESQIVDGSLSVRFNIPIRFNEYVIKNLNEITQIVPFEYEDVMTAGNVKREISVFYHFDDEDYDYDGNLDAFVRPPEWFPSTFELIKPFKGFKKYVKYMKVLRKAVVFITDFRYMYSPVQM